MEAAVMAQSLAVGGEIRLWTIWRRPCGKNTPGLRPRDFDRVWRFAAGGRPVFPAASAPPAIALAQQVGHRLGRHRLADQVALQLAAADAAQEVALGGGPDALGEIGRASGWGRGWQDVEDPVVA